MLQLLYKCPYCDNHIQHIYCNGKLYQCILREYIEHNKRYPYIPKDKKFSPRSRIIRTYRNIISEYKTKIPLSSIEQKIEALKKSYGPTLEKKYDLVFEVGKYSKFLVFYSKDLWHLHQIGKIQLSSGRVITGAKLIDISEPGPFNIYSVKYITHYIQKRPNKNPYKNQRSGILVILNDTYYSLNRRRKKALKNCKLNLEKDFINRCVRKTLA